MDPKVKPAARPIDPQFRISIPPFHLGRSRPFLEIAQFSSTAKDFVRDSTHWLIQPRLAFVTRVPSFRADLPRRLSFTLINANEKASPNIQDCSGTKDSFGGSAVPIKGLVNVLKGVLCSLGNQRGKQARNSAQETVL